MAFSQVVPKSDPVRNNQHTNTLLVRRTDDELIGPDLPWTIDWHPQTKEWWDMWRRHEIAPLLEPSDWHNLLDTARLHHDFWTGHMSMTAKVSYATELRKRTQDYGASFADRLKLRVIYADAQTKEQAVETGKKKAIDYKAMFADEEEADDSQ